MYKHEHAATARGRRHPLRRGPLLAALASALLGTALVLPALLAPAAGARSLDTSINGRPVHILPTPRSLPLGSGVSELELASPRHKKVGFLKQLPGSDPPLVYKPKGTVQSEPKVYLIFWGENWLKEPGAATKTALKKMFEGISKSVYQEILTQYFDEEKNVSAALALKTYTDGSVGAPKEVNGAAIEKEVEAAIKANEWAREANAQFVVIPAPGSTYEKGFNEAEGGFCAYHGIDGAKSSYTFDPYAGDEPFKASCQEYDAEKNVKNVTTMLASHEYAESATDPLLNAWRTVGRGEEISDICLTGDDLFGGSWVQGQWDNNKNACALEHAKPPKVYAITKAASGVGTTEATLNGTVNPEGAETKYHFEYGTTTAYGTSVPVPDANAGAGRKNVEAANLIKGLTTKTTYHFRLVATNATGTMNGLDTTFKTS